MAKKKEAEVKAEPKVKAKVKVEPKVKAEPKTFVPMLGEKFLLNDEIAEVVDFNPLQVVIHEIVNGCQSVRETEIDSIAGAEYLCPDEAFRRLA